MPVKTKKQKRGFLDGYKTYDTSSGFGNPSEWKSKFKQRMSFEEAQTILDNENLSPEEILGITGIYTFEHVKYQFRKMIFTHHPDRGGTEEMAKRIIAAYEVLKHKFGEK